jgi:hypothetical protein
VYVKFAIPSGLRLSVFAPTIHLTRRKNWTFAKKAPSVIQPNAWSTIS